MALYKYVFLLLVISSIIFADRVTKKGKRINTEPAPQNFTFKGWRVEANGEVRVMQFNPAKRSWNTEPSKMVRPEFRVVGGRRTRTKEVPYQALIGVYGFLQTCGATIYNKLWIITAAHCFYNNTNLAEKSGLYVQAGVFDYSKKERTVQTRNISQFITHTDYIPSPGLFNDIALAKLDKPLVYTDVVQPLPIGPASDEYPLVGEAVISGWGYTLALKNMEEPMDDFYSPVLKSTIIDVYTKEECIKIYSRSQKDEKAISTYPSIMCAGRTEGGRDACQGDSGGPLQCFDSTRKKYLCGVVATGAGCGQPNKPGFYTIVNKYAGFIKKNAGEGDQPTVHY